MIGYLSSNLNQFIGYHAYCYYYYMWGKRDCGFVPVITILGKTFSVYSSETLLFGNDGTIVGKITTRYSLHTSINKPTHVTTRVSSKPQAGQYFFLIS